MASNVVLAIRLFPSGEEAVHVTDNTDATALVQISNSCSRWRFLLVRLDLPLDLFDRLIQFPELCPVLLGSVFGGRLFQRQHVSGLAGAESCKFSAELSFNWVHLVIFLLEFAQEVARNSIR